MTNTLPDKRPEDSPAPAEGGAGRTIAWAVIVLSIGWIAVTNWRETRSAASVKATSASVRVDPILEIIGRYAVGVNSLFNKTGSGTSPAEALLPQIEKSADSYADKLAVITVIADLQGKRAALDRLKVLQKSLPGPLMEDAGILHRIYSEESPPATAAERTELRRRLGWFADLAWSFGKPAADPERKAVLAAAKRTSMALGAAVAAIGLIAVAGISLLIFALVRYADGKLRTHYVPTRRGGPYLEAFAIYIGGIAAAVAIVPVLPGALRSSLAAHIGLMVIPTIFAFFWPFLRGAADWPVAMGWYSGRGAFKEIGCGVAGYVAAFPILAVGFLITLALIKASGSKPTHPIDQMIGGSASMTLMIYLLASVYAPITEETLFRGAFFGALRSRHGWFWSATVSSFVFAAVHPQGWSVIPALMSIAIALAAIREWRGTILSSATAHCLHNTLLVTFATWALG